MEPIHKTGRIRKGWELTKSSWQVLKLDKELTGLPIISIVVSVVVIVAYTAVYLLYLLHHATGSFAPPHHNISFASHGPSGWVNVVFTLGLYVGLSLVGTFFSAAIIYGATERFKGGDPTVRSSLRGARRKFGPLALFGLMMGTVGLLLQILAERVPFAGKIAVWLFGSAWSIANVFAVPVIVLSDKNVQPLEATRESVRIIRKVWGESVVLDAGLTLVTVLAVFGYVFFWVLLLTLAIPAITHAAAVMVPLGILAGVGLVVLTAVFATLASIAKAALYHYATTGKAPELFNQELLQAGMTRKKARKIFA